VVEPSFFVYDFCDATKHVQGGGYNRDKDVEALRKKLNCLAFGVIICCTHVIFFLMITCRYDTPKYYRLAISLVFHSCNDD